MDSSRPDPDQVHTMAEWLEALAALRGGRTYIALDRAVNPRLEPRVLSRATLSDLFNKGRPSIETLELFLRACGVPREERKRWQRARERALSDGVPGTAGLIRVFQAKPRRLGVHAAIDVPGAIGELPAYVERDIDTADRGVRALIQQASEEGGMVLLVGEPSAGKTRCAFEIIRALLPDWWLLRPDDADHVRAIAVDPPARLVVWLDELQHYLDGSDALRVGTVRTLLEVARSWSPRSGPAAVLPTPLCRRQARLTRAFTPANFLRWLTSSRSQSASAIPSSVGPSNWPLTGTPGSLWPCAWRTTG